MGQGEVGGANYAAKLTFIFATDSSVFIMATIKSCGVLAVHKSTLITNTGIIQNKWAIPLIKVSSRVRSSICMQCTRDVLHVNKSETGQAAVEQGQL